MLSTTSCYLLILILKVEPLSIKRLSAKPIKLLLYWYKASKLILPVDQNVGTCLVKGSTCAPLQSSVLLQNPPQEPAKEQSGAAAADRTPTPKSVTEPPNTKSKNTQEISRNCAMFSLTVSSRIRKRKENNLNARTSESSLRTLIYLVTFSPDSYRPGHVARIQSYTCHHLGPPWLGRCFWLSFWLSYLCMVLPSA